MDFWLSRDHLSDYFWFLDSGVKRFIHVDLCLWNLASCNYWHELQLGLFMNCCSDYFGTTQIISWFRSEMMSPRQFLHNSNDVLIPEWKDESKFKSEKGLPIQKRKPSDVMKLFLVKRRWEDFCCSCSCVCKNKESPYKTFFLSNKIKLIYYFFLTVSSLW